MDLTKFAKKSKSDSSGSCAELTRKYSIQRLQRRFSKSMASGDKFSCATSWSVVHNSLMSSLYRALIFSQRSRYRSSMPLSVSSNFFSLLRTFCVDSSCGTSGFGFFSWTDLRTAEILRGVRLMRFMTAKLSLLNWKSQTNEPELE